MKIKFWQKLYLCVLFVFLLFFNGGIFAIVTAQNSKALAQQKENFLTQQEYILQQIVNDMSLVYESRPLGIPLIIRQYGDRYANNGVLMQVKKGEELVYSSIKYEYYDDYIDFPNKYLQNRVSEIAEIEDEKYFIVECNLPNEFAVYGTLIAFPIQSFFDDWNGTILMINVICCTVSAIMAVVLYNLLKALTKPIQSLNEATIRFGKGDMTARIEHITNDEIGETANNFNIMAQQICTQMQTLADSAQEKQNFINDFSHEMRTPLTAIRGYSQYMQRARIDGEEYYNTLEIIDRQAYRLQNLSESMLALSISDMEQLNFTDVKISQVLKDIRLSLQPKLQKNKVNLEIICDETLTVKGESSLIESLIANLVDNAINACKADETKENHYVKINSYNSNDKAVITVEDNGIGMSCETMEKIHVPFYREDKSRSRQNGGAGLGGSIIKKIADVHGATLEYTSVHGKGTTATVIFTTL
ncbi:MAG: HAMP domain-containing histidine kinase [Oscillospiraceae bacterium]|nr:HAMP domain-containing histidine kinase [Oscillospiraceae bacterium]